MLIGDFAWASRGRRDCVVMTNPEIQSIKNRFGIIGNAPALNYALNVAMQVAGTDLTVLITGESGSGKGIVFKNYSQPQCP
jgi:DNA-binding NtrC family response regulator